MLIKMPCKNLAIACLCVVSLGAFAGPPFTVSIDGLEVVDAKTGLTWRRCAEGMIGTLSGCIGSANTYTHETALARANNQVGWRLPNVIELSSILNMNSQNPSIDIVAFPDTPSSVFWSSTPDLPRSESSWTVNFGTGVVISYFRVGTNYVRLVRGGQ